MTFQEELLFLSPEPLQVGGEAIYSLTLRQVLGFLCTPQDPYKLESFLRENHSEVTSELIQLYEVSTYLLQVDPAEKSSAPQESKSAFKNGHTPLLITTLIHSVCQEFKMSWNDVLDMWISHFHLAIRHIKNTRERELEEIKKRKKR